MSPHRLRGDQLYESMHQAMLLLLTEGMIRGEQTVTVRSRHMSAPPKQQENKQYSCSQRTQVPPMIKLTDEPAIMMKEPKPQMGC